MRAYEANIDGLVGPSHNYAGLSFGNVASEAFALSVSNPKQAALQGLKKMRFVRDLGIPQFVMPPHPRPHTSAMRKLGFRNISQVPAELLGQLYSASSMWVANAATISASADCADGKVHITPANLLNKFHRSLEAETTAKYLKHMFQADCFAHHAPLPPHALFSDEGAANHMRLCNSHGEKGLEIFVYGADTGKYPARQSPFASQAVARLHRLDENRTFFLRQKPLAIDAGVFHNDVIAMSNEYLLIFHENAFDETYLKGISDHPGIKALVIKETELPLATAVSTYFFNSQLLTLPSGKMAVIAPLECNENIRSRECFAKLIAEGHIESVYYFDLRESMKNGGGPACLRLRAPLSQSELEKVNDKFTLNDLLYDALCQWIEKHYRDRIAPDDLRDPKLAQESENAMAELYNLLGVTAEAA